MRTAEPLIRLHHDYGDRRVLLDVWRVNEYRGEPRGLEAQPVDWVAPDDLPAIDLLEADRPIITALRMPCVARCMAGAAALATAAESRRPESLLWRPLVETVMSADIPELVRQARRAGHRVIVTGNSISAVRLAADCGADGLLLESPGAMRSIDPEGAFLVGAICASPAEAAAATAAGAHFLVLLRGSGLAEPRRLARMVQQLGLPAYLGWYPDAGSLELARASGAHGCAIGPAAKVAGGHIA